MIGVLGGMGSAAGLDFCSKLLEENRRSRAVNCDQDQVPFVLWSEPKIPDRSEFINRKSNLDPLPLLRDGILRLNELSVEVIAIACNTAHFWHDELSSISRAPILHIVDAVISELRKNDSQDTQVGLVGSWAMLSSNLYQSRLSSAGFQCVVPTIEQVEEWVWPAILAVKRGYPREGVGLIERAYSELVRRGVKSIVLACTELPLIEPLRQEPENFQVVDSNRSLARACLAYHYSHCE